MIIDQIMGMAISNGIFAALFVFLFFYQLKDSAKREKKYQETIKSLTKSFETVTDIKENVLEIKNIVVFDKKKGKVKNEI
ncbi:MAG: BhlA/UviB family holin-like peptide [Christensenellales bacterium]|jgi:preprotein translocase subunit YajC